MCEKRLKMYSSMYDRTNKQKSVDYGQDRKTLENCEFSTGMQQSIGYWIGKNGEAY